MSARADNLAAPDVAINVGGRESSATEVISEDGDTFDSMSSGGIPPLPATKPGAAKPSGSSSGDSVPLTLKVARARKRRVAGPLATCTQERHAQTSGMRSLLEKMRARHHAYAAMHIAAGRSAASFHRNFTVAILVITLVTTLVTNVIQDLVEPVWTTLVSNVALALIAGLTAINNFLGYQKREVEHRDARNAHLRAADLIDIAIACDDEDPDVNYDYASVLEEIQEIHDGLKKLTVGIPTWIAEKYPEYEAPWLLRSEGSSDSDDAKV
jgi:hypothetical protein